MRQMARRGQRLVVLLGRHHHHVGPQRSARSRPTSTTAARWVLSVRRDDRLAAFEQIATGEFDAGPMVAGERMAADKSRPVAAVNEQMSRPI